MPARPQPETLGSRFVHTARRRWSSFCVADAIPTLGPGKVDLRAVRQLAAERSVAS
jgi:hypothetical protein